MKLINLTHKTMTQQTVNKYEAHTEDLTVYHIDRHGERHDLNATGTPCKDVKDLIDFINELHDQGAFSNLTREELINQALPLPNNTLYNTRVRTQDGHTGDVVRSDDGILKIALKNGTYTTAPKESVHIIDSARWILSGVYKNGDAYSESTTSIYEAINIMNDIYRMWHDLESIEAEPHEIIDPYSLTLEYEVL